MFRALLVFCSAVSIAVAGYSPISIDTNAIDIQPPAAPGQLVSSADASRLTLNGESITNWQDLIYILGTNEFPEPEILPAPPENTTLYDNPYVTNANLYLPMDEDFSTNLVIPDKSGWTNIARCNPYPWRRGRHVDYAYKYPEDNRFPTGVILDNPIFPEASAHHVVNFWYRYPVEVEKDSAAALTYIIDSDAGEFIQLIINHSTLSWTPYSNEGSGYVGTSVLSYPLFFSGNWVFVSISAFAGGNLTPSQVSRVYTNGVLAGTKTASFFTRVWNSASIFGSKSQQEETYGTCPAYIDDFMVSWDVPSYTNATRQRELYKYWRSLAPEPMSLTSPTHVSKTSTTLDLTCTTPVLNKGALWVYYEAGGVDQGTTNSNWSGSQVFTNNAYNGWHVGERDGVTVTQRITGLTSGTLYGYRWMSSNVFGTAWSDFNSTDTL